LGFISDASFFNIPLKLRCERAFGFSGVYPGLTMYDGTHRTLALSFEGDEAPTTID